MKRPVAALAFGLALALTPIAAHASGDAHLEGHKTQATAQATRHHHHARPASHVAGHKRHHHAASCQTATRCRRPAPLPVPDGGWPCAHTHSCAAHHHYPICKPPVVAHPRPPVVKHHHPRKHHVVHRTPAPRPAAPVTVPDALPRTGGLYEAGLVGAGGLIGTGIMLVALVLLTAPERRWMAHLRHKHRTA